MKVEEAISSRSSCRIFNDREVDRELLQEVCELGLMAPSALNLQPWLLTAVMGPELGRLSRKMAKAARERQVRCSPESKEPLAEIYVERQRELNRLMGPAIKATTSPWPDFINEGGLYFYGAPAALIISGEAGLAHDGRLDLGILLGYLLLAAQSKGLSTCPIGLVSAYDGVVREALNLDAGRPVILALAIGYPDEGAEVNRVKMVRANPDQVLRWYQ